VVRINWRWRSNLTGGVSALSEQAIDLLAAFCVEDFQRWRGLFSSSGSLLSLEVAALMACD